MPVRRAWQVGDRVRYGGWPDLGTVTGFMSTAKKDYVYVQWDHEPDVQMVYPYHSEGLIKQVNSVATDAHS